MKRMTSALLSCLLAALLFAGCAAEAPSSTSNNQNGDGQPQLSDDIPDSTPENTPDSIPANPSETPAVPEAPVPSYYGSWEITGMLATSQIYAMGEDEIAARTGRTVSYSAEQCVSADGTVWENPAYTEEQTTAAALQEDYQTAGLGLPDGEVHTVSVEGCFDLGGFAVIRDADTLIFYQDGVWFEAVRTA